MDFVIYMANSAEYCCFMHAAVYGADYSQMH